MINMPYLLYPPGATETTKPTYAVGYPDPVDEIILQDLRKWGWRVEETTQTDPKWLTAVQEYHARMQGPPEEEGVTRPSLWEFWRDETARRAILEGGTTKKRSKLKKSLRPSPTSSQKDNLSSLTKRKGTEKVASSGEEIQCRDRIDEQADKLPAPTRERRTIAQLRTDTAQKKEVSEDWNAPNAATSLGPLDPNHSNIYRYDDEGKTLAEARAQLDQEIKQEVVNWVGIGGVYRTTQVSVHSEAGICVDNKGKQVFFPPKYQLPLFEWEDEVSRTNSTKSKDYSAKGSLECVASEPQIILGVTDKDQEKDEPDQETSSIG